MAYLLCWDFDGTLVNGHFHNALFDMGIKPGAATKEQVLALIQEHELKHAKETCAAIREALQTGNYVAVLSFTHYPEIIPHTLSVMGLHDDEIEKIFIRGGFPTGGPMSPIAKNEHLQAAKDNFKITDNKQVILVDDSSRNISAAANAGYQAIFVPKGTKDNPAHPSYLYTLQNKISELSGIVPKPNPLRKTIHTTADWKELVGSDDFSCLPSSSSSSSSYVPSASPARENSFVPRFRSYCASDDDSTPYGSSCGSEADSPLRSPLRRSGELKASL